MYHYSIATAFCAVAARFAARPALKMTDGRTITYGELDAAANRAARLLKDRGIGRRSVVAILNNKTLDDYAAILACLKLGAAYVNLDDTNPGERLARIFSTCRPKLVVGVAPADGAQTAARTVGAGLVDWRAPEVRAVLDTGNLAPPPDMEMVIGADPAYIMYTSGSTGTPKGAAITHANVLNFAHWTATRFGIRPDDILTNVNPMYFDNSVFDLYGSLLNGAAMAPIPRPITADARACIDAVEAAGCTVWFSVPSLLIYLMTTKALASERLPTLRTFVFGGEGFPKPELRKFHGLYGHRVRLVNVYGPTECTCICSAHDVTQADLDAPDNLVTLGQIAENFDALVVDDDAAPVAAGGVGELCLAGPQVGLGYYNDPERTALAFRANPINPAWTERTYFTGDLVRLGADGRTLSFVGRKDNQIKQMGYRIELEEIEAALYQVEGVIQAAVVHKANRFGRKHIVAYVSVGPEEADLRRALKVVLPDYMIPQRIAQLATLPRNANGKIDRRALTDLLD
jgi:D-alanine--poly(phosphoribitol) ligase subunit 1